MKLASFLQSNQTIADLLSLFLLNWRLKIAPFSFTARILNSSESNSLAPILNPGFSKTVSLSEATKPRASGDLARVVKKVNHDK